VVRPIADRLGGYLEPESLDEPFLGLLFEIAMAES
jgi:hypothetical protein